MVVKCPSCGAENPDYSFYCGKCAAELKRGSTPEATNKAIAKHALEEDLMKEPTDSHGRRRKRVAFVVMMLIGSAAAALGIVAGLIFNWYLAALIWVLVEGVLFVMVSQERKGKGPLG